MNKKVLIVSANYYKNISDSLKIGATNFLNENKIYFEIIDSPGSFEIPYIINRNLKLYDGFIALGCIIRGETYHFELISNECSRKIMDLSISSNKPIGFGILTCENMDQALQRADVNSGNKGKEAAKACLDLLKLNYGQ
tara:strand:- start:110 stop:526 length:417 start_codon:yes stop_codon:yes gene_type:complete